MKLRELVKSRWPELLLVALGAALRISMLVTYPTQMGYDFSAHWLVVDWYRQHIELPPMSLSPEVYHPPLYYVVTGLWARLYADPTFVAGLTVFLGIVRLGLIWLALELFLPGRTMARRVALALAAVISSSVQLEGMVTGEGFNNFFAIVEIVLIPFVFRAEGKKRLYWALALGGVVMLHLLSKVSAMSMIGAIGLGGALELALRSDAPTKVRWQRFGLVTAGIVVVLLGSGWYFAGNVRQFGKPFLTGWEGMGSSVTEGWKDLPYWERRPPSFVFGWSTGAYASPYWPASVQPVSHFFPVLIASTFVDYYNYSFGTPKGYSGPLLNRNGQNLREGALLPSQLASVAGSWIALMTTLAWCAAFVATSRARDFGLLTLLLVPLFAVLGQLHLAISYPVDWMGPVKGLYMQFSAPVLYAMFGVGVAWLWRRRAGGKALAGVSLVALGMVGFYSVYCRFF